MYTIGAFTSIAILAMAGPAKLAGIVALHRVSIKLSTRNGMSLLDSNIDILLKVKKCYLCILYFILKKFFLTMAVKKSYTCQICQIFLYQYDNIIYNYNVTVLQ